MPESVNASAPQPKSVNLESPQAKLDQGSVREQLRAAADLHQAGEAGWRILESFLLQRLQENMPVTPVDGRCYELLMQAEHPTCDAFLAEHFATGVVPLRSDAAVDYQPLQKLLATHQFLEADRLTLKKLCELAGPDAAKRQWLYFTEVDFLPATDLQTLNYLWLIHSEGKFGFSVQRQLWLSVGGDWEVFWPKILWKSGKNWTRYPNEFIWDLSAPKGHLPLSNQLRGVRTFEALLSHPAWTAAG